jgi:hypothetical protein
LTQGERFLDEQRGLRRLHSAAEQAGVHLVGGGGERRGAARGERGDQRPRLLERRAELLQIGPVRRHLEALRQAARTARLLLELRVLAGGDLPGRLLAQALALRARVAQRHLGGGALVQLVVEQLLAADLALLQAGSGRRARGSFGPCALGLFCRPLARRLLQRAIVQGRHHLELRLVEQPPGDLARVQHDRLGPQRSLRRRQRFARIRPAEGSDGR